MLNDYHVTRCALLHAIRMIITAKIALTVYILRGNSVLYLKEKLNDIGFFA